MYYNFFTTLIYKFRKFKGFLRVESRCTIFRQSRANNDKKLVFLSLDMIYVSNINRIYFKHIQQSYLG